jgi:hypothetical protein
MPIRRPGFNDTLIDARLSWINGSAYPAAPSTLFVSLLAGVPLSDGSGVVEETPRVSVSFGSPTTPPGHPGHPHTRNITPTGSLSFTPAGQAAPGAHVNGVAWALWSASSGGTPLYVGAYNWSLLVGVATVLPASTFVITATEAT